MIHIWDKFANIQKIVERFEAFVPKGVQTHKVVPGSTPMVCQKMLT